MDRLGDVLRWAGREIEPRRVAPGHTPPPPELVDLSEVQGQARARRAVEVARSDHATVVAGADEE